MHDQLAAQRFSEKQTKVRTRANLAKRIAIVLCVLVVGGLTFWWFRDRLSLEYLASQELVLRKYQQTQPILSAVLAISIYILVTGFSLPGAVVLTLACAWFFGFWQALLIVSLGSTAGATMAFLLTRYLLRDWVQQRFAEKLSSINSAFDREGPFYLFTLRLIPAVPFFVINAVMGLTKIRAVTFWWVSQLGMLPGTIAYVYAGASVPSLETLAKKGVGSIVSWQLLSAFVVLGLLPIAVKRIMQSYLQQHKLNRQTHSPVSDSESIDESQR